MSVLNNLTIIGNVTRDSELRHFSKKDGTDTTVVVFGLANNKKIGDKETTLFLEVEYFGKEVIFTKGQRVLVEGELRDGSYEKDGVKVNKVKVVANMVLDFSGKKTEKTEQAPTPAKTTGKKLVNVVSEEDVPF